MKPAKSIFMFILFIVVFTHETYSQNEKYHHVTFGADNSNEQFQDYYLDQAITSISTNQKHNNILEIQTDFNMSYIWIYNNLGFEIFNQIDTNYTTVSLPTGLYNIITGYFNCTNQVTILTKENIEVISNNQLKFSYKDAVFSNIYTFKKLNSDSLNISSIFFYLFNQMISTGLRIAHLNYNSTYYILNHNSLPEHFESQWAIKGKPFYNNSDLYLLNGELLCLDSDTTVTNDLSNFSDVNFNYYLPDSIDNSRPKKISTFMPDFHANGSGDIEYTFPFTQRIIQDISADISLFTSKYWQSPYVKYTTHVTTSMNTSEIRLAEGKIIGYHYRDPYAPPFTVSDTNYVQLGQPPSFWFGQFSNSVDTIKIQSPYGQWPYLFLTQTNDLLQHHPIDYKISQNLALIDSGQFNLWYGPWALRLGFDRNDLAIPVQLGE